MQNINIYSEQVRENFKKFKFKFSEKYEKTKILFLEKYEPQIEIFLKYWTILKQNEYFPLEISEHNDTIKPETITRNRKITKIALTLLLIWFLLSDWSTKTDPNSIFNHSMYQDQLKSQIFHENFKNKHAYANAHRNLFKNLAEEQLERDGYGTNSGSDGNLKSKFLDKWHTLSFRSEKIVGGGSASDNPKFYIYDAPEYNWLGNCSNYKDWMIGDHLNDKHGDDLQFIFKIPTHPWRTLNPKKADIFILPVLLAMVWRLEQIEGVNCMGKTLHQMQDITAAALSEDAIFKKYYTSKPHLIVASHYEMRKRENYSPLFKVLLKNFIFGSFEDFPSLSNKNVAASSKEQDVSFDKWEDMLWKDTIVVPYVDVQPEDRGSMDRLGPPHGTSYKDPNSRPIDFFFVGQYDNRPAYSIRRNLASLFASHKLDDLNIIYGQHIGMDDEARLYGDYTKIPCNIDKCLIR